MHFQLHGMRQQSSENKSAALKKSYYFCSHALIERPKVKKKDKQNKKPMHVKALATPVCKKSKQKQTNRSRYEYHLVSGSRDISQL